VQTGNRPRQIALFVSGDGVFAEYVISNLQALGGARVAAVFCDKEDKGYRTFSAVPGLRTHLLDYSKGQATADGRILEILSSFAPGEIDACFLTYDRILGERVLAKLPGRFFNLHLSLLPLYPMLHALDRSTEGAELFYGASLHEVTPEVDRGRLLGQLILAKDPRKSVLEHRLELLGKARHFYLDMIHKLLFESTRDAGGRLVLDRARYGTLPYNPALSIPLAEP
jgi:phosphoribosylglycinamide formyltransferase-1